MTTFRMINRLDDPFAWSLFLSELEEAHEALGSLLKEVAAETDYAEPELRIDLAHVYAHLNRAWHRRALKEDFNDAQWEAAGKFPVDLDPGP